MANSKSSIEEQVEDWAKAQLSGNYFTKTEPINPQIESALKTAASFSQTGFLP